LPLLTLDRLPLRGEEKRTKEFRVPSPLMGEGEDEGESQRFDMPWHVATLIGRNKSNPYILNSFVLS